MQPIELPLNLCKIVHTVGHILSQWSCIVNTAHVVMLPISLQLNTPPNVTSVVFIGFSFLLHLKEVDQFLHERFKTQCKF